MRTTLTLDDDVATKLRSEAGRTGRPFKDVVNDVLRAGLHARRTARRKPFEVQARPLGLRAGLSYDRIDELLDRLEGEQRK